MSTMTSARRGSRAPQHRLGCLVGVLALLPLLGFLALEPSAAAPPAPDTVGAARVVSANAGEQYTCTLMSNGAIICWGDDTAEGAPVGKTSPPAGIFAQLEVGLHHACALDREGRATCWGWDVYGQLAPSSSWARYGQISAGWDRTCAIDTTMGDLDCWGQGPNPPADEPFTSYRQVSVGVHHACAVRYPDGEVICWGSDYAGATAVPDSARSGITMVSAGWDHSCAIEEASLGGDLICWGQNAHGQAPALVSGPFTEVSAGLAHTCALRADGTVACWGYNPDGRTNAPAGTFTQVSAGDEHSCATRSDGVAVCWGGNRYGETTLIDLAPAALPDAIHGTDYSQALAASGGAAPYSFALTSGALPNGLSLSPEGALSGRPQGVGVSSFTIGVTDGNGHRGGRAYLLVVNDALKSLLASHDSGQSSRFGRVSAIDGDRAVIAAEMGDAYIFERAAGINQPWHQTAKLGAIFGRSTLTWSTSNADIALSGDTFALLAIANDEYAEMLSLRLAIFARDPAAPDGGFYEQGALACSYPSTPAPIALALDGDNLAVICPAAEWWGMEWPASVEIVRRGLDPAQPTVWATEQTLDISSTDLALSGEILAVARTDETWIYGRHVGGTGQWGQVRTLPYSGPLALSGDTLLIGDPANDLVRVFRRDLGGSNSWGEAPPISRPSVVSADLVFGADVLLDGNVAVVQATGGDAGWSIVFGHAPGQPDGWRPLLRLYKVVGALALSGQTLLAPFDNVADPQREVVAAHWLQLASDLEVVAGAGQVRAPGTLLNPAPQVRVCDINGNPVPHFANVSFFGWGPGGSFVEPTPGDTAVAPTNADGIATMPAYRVGQTAGSYAITVKLQTNVLLDQEAIPFSVRVPGRIVRLLGSGQRTMVGTIFPAPLRVRVEDGAGQPVPGVQVRFSAPPGGASATLSAATVTTGADGTAEVTARANAVDGQYQITVTLPDFAAVPAIGLQLYNLPPPEQVTVSAGANQHIPVGSTTPVTLAVTLKDSAGDPIEGLHVTFSAPTGGPGGSFQTVGLGLSGASSVTVTSDAAGVATAPPFRANGIPGRYSITVTVEGSPAPVTIALTNDFRLYLMLIVRR